MAEQVLKFSIRTDGAQARAEAEATARAIVAAVRGAVSSASGAVGRAVPGAIGVNDRAVESLQRQRSAALIAEFRAQERAVEQARRSILTFDQALAKVGGSLRNLGLGLTSLGSSLSLGLTAPLLALGAAAFKSARDIDAQVNTLRAFTGSAETAEKRLAQLIETSRKTPGLTTALALQLDAQLRVAKVTEETIDRILPAIGRLNAVRPIADPDKFTQNLIQLITQNFERRDLKELVGNSPLAGQVITELFNVDSPINADAIRKAAERMGIRTVDDFFAAFAAAAARNKGLASVTESLGTRFSKLADRLTLALRPLGLALADSLGRVADTLLPVVEGLGRAFAALPQPVQMAVIGIGAFAAVLGPTLFIVGQFATGIGGLISAFGRLNALGLIPTIAGFRLLGQVMTGTASLSAGAAATTAAAAAGWALLSAAILGAVAASFAIVHGIESYLDSIREAHPWIVRFGKAFVEATPQGTIYSLLKSLGLIGSETKKVAAAQADALPDLRNFTEGVDEETQSLKQLKLALQEAEITARSYAALAQRDYNENRTTLSQYTTENIATVQQKTDAELRLIGEGLKSRQDELERLRGGPISPEKERELLNAISELETRKFKLLREAADEIANLQSEQRVKERQNEERHRESILAVLRSDADRRIEILRDSASRDESLRIQSEQRIAEIERETSLAEEQEIRRRIELAARGTEARVQLEDQLAQKLAERRRREDDARRRVRDAERADLESRIRALLTRREGLLDGMEATDAVEAASLKALGELRLISAISTENQLIEIERRGRQRRLTALREDVERARQLTDKQKSAEAVAAGEAALERERGGNRAFELSVANRQASAEREDLQRLKDLNAERKRIQYDALAEAIEVGRLGIEAMRRRHASREEIAVAERDTDLKEIELRRKRRHDELADEREVELARLRSTDLNARRKAEIRLLDAERNILGEEEYRARLQEINDRYDEEAAAKDASYLARKKELEDLFRQRDLLSEEEYQRRKKEIEDRYKRDTDADPFKRIKDFWTDFKNHVRDAEDSIRQSTAAIAETVVASFRSMEDATRQGIVAWLLYGESLGKALKTALAQSLAAVAADAAIQALKHAAYAIGSLAFGNPAAAAMHAKAALAFGALAIAAGVAARGLANSAGLNRSSSTSSAASVAAQDTKPNNQTFNYGGNLSTPASEEQGGGARGRGVVGGSIAGALNKLNTELSRIQGIPAGQVVRMGAPDAQDAIGVAVLGHSASNDGFNDSLARNMRVA